MAVLEKIEVKYLTRLKELIQFGENLPLDESSGESLRESVRRSARLEHRKPKDIWLRVEAYNEWFIRAINLLSSIPIQENHYRTLFESKVKGRKVLYRDLGLGILKGLYKDIENGDLQSPVNFIQTEIFSDFLEMAEHLCEQDEDKSKDPAAMLAGAVLEDSLRKVCIKNNISFSTDSNIGSLNQLLFKKQVYNKLKFKDIDSWKAIRDSAAHGHIDQYSKKDVKNFLSELRRFIGEYLS